MLLKIAGLVMLFLCVLNVALGALGVWLFGHFLTALLSVMGWGLFATAAARIEHDQQRREED